MLRNKSRESKLGLLVINSDKHIHGSMYKFDGSAFNAGFAFKKGQMGKTTILLWLDKFESEHIHFQ